MPSILEILASLPVVSSLAHARTIINELKARRLVIVHEDQVLDALVAAEPKPREPSFLED